MVVDVEPGFVVKYDDPGITKPATVSHCHAGLSKLQASSVKYDLSGRRTSLLATPTDPLIFCLLTPCGLCSASSEING